MIALLVHVFAIPSIAVTQDGNNSYQQQNQYQLPLNEPDSQQPEQPPINQPAAQTPPPESVAPTQKQPTLYQETPSRQKSTPQTATPEVSLPPPAADAPIARQVNLASPGYYVLYAAIIIFALFWFDWWRKWRKRKKTTTLPADDDGTVCKTCGGKGTIIKSRIIRVPCGHCKQTGLDICHYCGGSGRYNGGFTAPQTQEEVESFMECEYCRGKGFPKIPIVCCMCRGKKYEEGPESYEETCPTCKGTGRVPK